MEEEEQQEQQQQQQRLLQQQQKQQQQRTTTSRLKRLIRQLDKKLEELAPKGRRERMSGRECKRRRGREEWTQWWKKSIKIKV
jgi:hypothetical protein